MLIVRHERQYVWLTWSKWLRVTFNSCCKYDEPILNALKADMCNRFSVKHFLLKSVKAASVVFSEHFFSFFFFVWASNHNNPAKVAQPMVCLTDKGQTRGDKDGRQGECLENLFWKNNSCFHFIWWCRSFTLHLNYAWYFFQ